MSRCFALLLLLCPGFAAVALSYQILIPPIGWEEKITPGFDPPIEEIVVKMGRREWNEKERLEAVWKSWDADAVPVLTQLIEAPEWKEYRGYIAELIAYSPHPEAHEWAMKTLKTLGTTPDRPDEYNALFSSLLHHFSARHPEKVRELRDLYLEREDNPNTQYWALNQLLQERTEEAIARAEALAAKEPEAKTQEWMGKLIDETRGYLRAQKTMTARSQS